MPSNAPTGVMLNAYPDSIGRCLTDALDMLKRPEFEDAFSLFYILPTFFKSDLDRGFSVVEYLLNRELVQPEDLQELDGLGVNLKFDLVLNHLSVGSPQFQDLLANGDDSEYRDFFIDWNAFWQGHGEMGPEGYIIPDPECLDVLFMRKPGLPILKVRFPDGSERPYWNTFYQEVTYRELALRDLVDVPGIGREEAWAITHIVNDAIREGIHPGDADWGDHAAFREPVLARVEQTRKYLGQMDLNAQSEKVWAFYDETLGRLSEFGAKLVRLDAFAYLHKEPGKPNFFNKPGTWEYLDRLKELADNHGLTLLPEIHSEYGLGLHEEVASRGFVVYDFFFPGLVIDALHRGVNRHLLRWIRELLDKNIQTVNMLGCHDGIPVLDLRGNHKRGVPVEGLLSDREIEAVIDGIMAYGGRVKNLYGADGKKISYYQVNATFFSALGEDESRMRLARAIQMFMPGIPQVWYLDLFAGKNDYVAADKGGTGGHKEINRTTLETSDIEQGLKRLVVQDQLELIRLRNTFPAFDGELTLGDTDEHLLHMSWENRGAVATLKANLRTSGFTVDLRTADGEEMAMYYRVAADHARKR
jgi:sucrose phosphorylase